MTTDNKKDLSTWLQAPILPVVVANSIDEGLAMSEGLIRGGINQIEITLRTPQALAIIEAIAKQFPQMAVSAGTVLGKEQFDQAAQAGATLFISPGFTTSLAEHALHHNYAWVPGTATASEMMHALEMGFELVKFFPAMAAGGPTALAGISAPLPQIKVIPTGGVTLDNLPEWKKLTAVQACGGTWLTAGLSQEKSIADVVCQRCQKALATWHDA